MTAAEFRRGLPGFGFEITRLNLRAPAIGILALLTNSTAASESIPCFSLQNSAHFGATAMVPAFRYEILVTARKI